MNNGELSYDTEAYGNSTRRVIDGSELARVFGKDFKINVKTETNDTVSKNETKHIETQETVFKNSLLEKEIQFLNEKIKFLETNLKNSEERETNLSKKLDKAQETLHSQTLILSDMRHKSTQEAAEKPKGFFGRLLAK